MSPFLIQFYGPSLSVCLILSFIIAPTLYSPLDENRPRRRHRRDPRRRQCRHYRPPRLCPRCQPQVKKACCCFLKTFLITKKSVCKIRTAVLQAHKYTNVLLYLGFAEGSCPLRHTKLTILNGQEIKFLATRH